MSWLWAECCRVKYLSENLNALNNSLSVKICLHVSLVLCPRSHKLMFWSFFTGAGGFDDSEQEVLRRDCPRSFGQEPQGIGRARAAARHQGDQPQRPRQVRGERVNCWPRPSPTMKPNSFSCRYQQKQNTINRFPTYRFLYWAHLVRFNLGDFAIASGVTKCR